MDNTMQQISAIAAAIIGVAIVSVLVARNNQTSAVIQSAGNAFSSVLGVAMGGGGGGGGGGNSGGFAPNIVMPYGG